MLYLYLLAASIGVAPADERPSDIKKEHPGDTALSEAPDGGYQYKSFPGLSALYVFTGDSPGKSNCDAKCVSAWPALLVSEGEKGTRIGDWEVIVRADGARQWAYKGQPVYTRYHNVPFDASGEQAGFRPLKP
jgi:hypothetical protein